MKKEKDQNPNKENVSKDDENWKDLIKDEV